MTPTIGRIIHVHEPEWVIEGCMPAIVTALDNSKGSPLTIWATIFSATSAPRLIVITNIESWHDPRFCPNEVTELSGG